MELRPLREPRPLTELRPLREPRSRPRPLRAAGRGRSRRRRVPPSHWRRGLRVTGRRVT